MGYPAPWEGRMPLNKVVSKDDLVEARGGRTRVSLTRSLSARRARTGRSSASRDDPGRASPGRPRARRGPPDVEALPGGERRPRLTRSRWTHRHRTSAVYRGSRTRPDPRRRAQSGRRPDPHAVARSGGGRSCSRCCSDWDLTPGRRNKRALERVRQYTPSNPTA